MSPQRDFRTKRQGSGPDFRSPALRRTRSVEDVVRRADPASRRTLQVVQRITVVEIGGSIRRAVWQRARAAAEVRLDVGVNRNRIGFEVVLKCPGLLGAVDL